MSRPSVARAVLFTYTAQGRTYTDAFDQADGYEDPELQCEMTRSAVGDNFPDAIFSIGMNQAARDIMTNRRMALMGFPDYDHAEERAPEACNTCGSTADLYYGPDPYQDEINGDMTEIWLCDRCWQTSHNDI